MKWIDKLENVLIVLGGVFGLANIKEVMGIVLLSMQIIIILVKGVMKIINAIKLKNINEAIAEAEKLQDELNRITPKEEMDNGGKVE